MLDTFLAIAAQTQHTEEQKDKAAKSFGVSRERWDRIEDAIEDAMTDMLYPNFYA